MKPILTMELRHEQDVVLCRQRVRQIAELLSFERQDQTRIATAVSEIARNAYEYAGGGKVEFSLTEGGPQEFLITIRDRGPGIADLKSILNGTYVSKTGMGLGIVGAKRLMERFEIESVPGKETRITLGKPLSPKAPPLTPQRLRAVTDALMTQRPQSPFEEVQEQNQELLRALEELRARQAELAELNRELEETNRGVVALYAELDEKAATLKRANETKTSFLANLTHEFRTPLNSIISLTQLALSGQDGELNPEHKKQVMFIRKSAENLSELVNDLLDIAKVESGKIEIRPSEFELKEIMGALRGVVKPLSIRHSQVNLVFDEVPDGVMLYTDEGKVAQILRNLVSNALKYTEKGTVRVHTEIQEDGQKNRMIRFYVTDTGTGIAPGDHERIFDEFIQLESRVSSRFKGTGLGLSISRRLAGLLGGIITVDSELNKGSTFCLIIPARLPKAQPSPASVPFTGLTRVDPSIKHARKKILIIDDEESARYLLRQFLPTQDISILEARDGFEGIRLACLEKPDLIILDLQMPAMSGFYVLELLKQNPISRNIPVIVHTAMTLSDQEKVELARETTAVIPKDTASLEVARARVQSAVEQVFSRPQALKPEALNG